MAWKLSPGFQLSGINTEDDFSDCRRVRHYGSHQLENDSITEEAHLSSRHYITLNRSTCLGKMSYLELLDLPPNWQLVLCLLALNGKIATVQA